MANLRSSKKKVRKDLKRARSNAVYVRGLDETMRRLVTKESRTPEAVTKAYKFIDKSAKRGIISAQRASRLKSRVASG